MYQLKSLEDTIAAISTPSGQGGIGIIRLSGKDTFTVADKIITLKSQKKPSECKGFTVHYGWVLDEDQKQIDEVLVTIMRAPKSYTKENMVEISCHGGIVSLRAILNVVTNLGARLAEPGEFTKRAFLNGRIDLSQAEAVLDIIQSKTDTFLRVSTNQLKGELSAELESIREQLMTTYVEIEAIVNFPEDEIDAQGKEKINQDLKQAHQRVERLLLSSDQGKILKEGIKIVICGRANAGKSSLLNVFLKNPRAIVSDIAGTTRDTIEETAQIKGIPFQLIDTAGILEPRDLIEEEAVKRSRLYIQGADLVLFVIDGNQSLNVEDEELAKTVQDQNTIVILNKTDLNQNVDESRVKKIFSGCEIIKISARKKIAIETLEDAIVNNVWHGKALNTQGILVSNVRHINSLKQCEGSLLKAFNGFQENLSLEFISEEIKVAVNCLDNITGRNIDQDLLDTIFSQFCIGK